MGKERSVTSSCVSEGGQRHFQLSLSLSRSLSIQKVRGVRPERKINNYELRGDDWNGEIKVASPELFSVSSQVTLQSEPFFRIGTITSLLLISVHFQLFETKILTNGKEPFFAADTFRNLRQFLKFFALARIFSYVDSYP